MLLVVSKTNRISVAAGTSARLVEGRNRIASTRSAATTSESGRALIIVDLHVLRE
jgi:hypothetical protein